MSGRAWALAVPMVVRVNPADSDAGWRAAGVAGAVPRRDAGQGGVGRCGGALAQDAGGVGVLPLIESAAGLAALPTIAEAPGVIRLVVGHIDFMG